MPDRVGVDGLTVLERVARNGPTFRVLKLDEEPSRRTAIDIELEHIPCDDERGRSEFAARQSGVGGDEADAAQRLLVYLETETQGFTNIEVCFDREEWREEAAQFDWTLNKGSNILEVRSRNNAGVTGIVSTLSLEG